MKNDRLTPHPIPYQGSKRSLAKHILPYMPQRLSRLVEPFAGSAAISLAVADNNRANCFWINDAHEPLVSLWHEIINHPEDLARQYELLWKQQLGQERTFYNWVRNQFNETHKPQYFLYLLARCVKAAIRYNSEGKFNNTPDNRRKGASPHEMRNRILGASELLRNTTTITCLDYREVLEQCQADDIVYLDPPYQGVDTSTTRDHRYAATISHDQFHESLHRLNERHINFIVSYDGRCGKKQYGKPLPPHLNLHHVELCAGRSTQATLLGRDDITYESLYISRALYAQAGLFNRREHQRQLAFA